MKKNDTNFHWRGKTMRTAGELMDVLIACTPEEAKDFMAAYRAFTPHADRNIGYMAGYYGEETAKKIWAATETEHPVFGTSWPSAQQAFDMGVAKGKNMKGNK